MATLFTRRGFARLCLGALGAGVGSLAYMRMWEPFRLRAVRHRVPPAAGAPAHGLRVLHISDLHASGVVPLEFINYAVQLGLAQEPDLICLTGDYVTHKIANAPDYAAILRQLSAAAPTFACLGNHDGGKWAFLNMGYRDTAPVQQLLADAGITCLRNAAQHLEVKGRPVSLIGLADFWAEAARPAPAFAAVAGANPAAYRIVLSHNPDSKKFLVAQPWDLLLCGHTHGGQFAAPIIGTPFAPVADRRYVAGLKPWNDRWIHVTRGVGNILGLRFNCPPEVSVLELG